MFFEIQQGRPRINTLRCSLKFNRAGKGAKNAKVFLIALRAGRIQGLRPLKV